VYVRNMSNPDNFIIMKVLTKEPDIMKVREDKHMIRTLEAWSDDGGRTFQNIKPPKPVSSKKVMINYKETGGEDKDGVIELRRGVKDLDLGSNHYAQVRIAVDGTHYLKGMAVYADDLPKGVDIRFNTNKSKDVPKMDVLKKLKDGGDFATLAKENSNDTANASNGGDLGWSSKEDNSFVKEFKDAAYALSKDKTSDVVKTSFGYHIIKVLDEKDSSFEELKPALAEKAAEEAVKKDTTIVSKALKKLFEEYNVKSSNSDVEAYIKSMLEGTASAQ